MKTFRKLFFSAAAIFGSAGNCFAQNYSITPNDTIQMVGLMEDLETLSIQQVNTSQNTIILQWEKVSESVPPAWDADVCDNFICYTSLVDSGTMNAVVPGDYGFLLLHITPHVNFGTAIIRYAVWDTANPAMKDTLTYILTVNVPSGVQEAKAKNTCSIFPNPANEHVRIESKFLPGLRYVVADFNGKVIQDGITSSSSITISTTGLPNGIYSIEIADLNSAQKFIVKH